MLAGEAQATGQDGTTLSYNTKSSNESKKQLEIAVETARLKVAMEAATRRFLRRIDTDDESGDELRIFSHDPIISGPLVCQLCNTDFINQKSFTEHKKQCHSGECEYRKRVLFLTQEQGCRPITG